MVSHIRAHPLPVLLRTSEEFSIPHLRDAMAATKNALDYGFGFCVVQGLPIDDYEIDEIVACFWVLGQLVDRPVAQKWDGTMIYDVTDTGEEFRYGVRGSYTNVELPFHNDNAFGTSCPELCRAALQTFRHERWRKSILQRLQLAQPITYDLPEATEATLSACFF